MCLNPLEFESAYPLEDEIHYLFKISDWLMNPKCEDRSPSDNVPRIADVVGTALGLPEVEEVLVAVVAKLNHSVILTKDKLLALRPQELCELLDKTSKKCINKDQDLGNLDRQSGLNKFYATETRAFLENIMKIQVKNADIFLFIIDLIFRVLVKCYVKSRHVVSDDKLQYLKKEIVKKDQNFHELVYTIEESNFINKYMNIHKTNFGCIDTKASRLIEIAQRFDVLGICEVNHEMFKLLQSKIKDTNQIMFPENPQSDPKKFQTVCLQNKELKLHCHSYVNDRILSLIFMPRVLGYFNLNIVHLSSGQSQNERLAELDLLNEKSNEMIESNPKQNSRKTCKIVMGDFNQDLQSNTLEDNKINDLQQSMQEDEHRNTYTSVKMRSAMQYQVSKMRKQDKSCKDAIISDTGCDYAAEHVNFSDHKLVQID